MTSGGCFSRGPSGRPLSLGLPLPLLLLLLLSLLPREAPATCQVGTANECKRAEPAPGANLAGEGYDVVRLAHTGAYVVDVHSWRRRDGTCTLCRNGLMEGALQRLPRAAVDWRVRQECRREVRSALYESEAELAQEGASTVDKSWTADLVVQPKPGASSKAAVAGSQSKMANFARRRSASDRYSFASQTFRCQFYQYRLVHRPPLAPQFRRLLRELPRRLAPSTQFFYHRFRRTFGTHYIKAVHLGGQYRDVTAMRTCKVAADGQTAEEVKDCLQVEAGVHFGDKVEANAKYESCKEARQKMEGRLSFHQEYQDRLSEMVGGTARAGLDLLFSEDSGAFSGWVDSLATHPGVIYSVLEPLHLLVRRGDPRRANLRTAISHYILQSGQERNCSARACPHGARADPRQPCSCRCAEDARQDKQCCPKGKGWAKLGVLVVRGQDLWGDYGSATDAYVKASYGPLLRASTGVIANDNNPVWNVTLDLGDLQLQPGLALRLEVWDRDNGYDDDVLGACERVPTSGRHPDVCYFSYGSLTFELLLTCAPHLGGATCQDYVARSG